MGIRETQIIGLNNKARKFLQKNCRKVADMSCPHCWKQITEKLDKKDYDSKTGVQLGMFDDGPVLYKYKLKDGRTAKEIVQCAPWSSGPMIFLCLKIGKKNKFKWTKKEINDYQ